MLSRTAEGHHPKQFFVGSFADGMHCGTDVVQYAHDSRHRLGLDQLTDDLVVEVVDRHPLDSLLHILFLENIHHGPDSQIMS